MRGDKVDKINLKQVLKDKTMAEKFSLDYSTNFSLLGHGEYNINYLFYSKNYNKNLLLRIATDSQMNLSQQITYEYKSLELLEKSGRTPKPLYFNDDKKLLPFGYLVMDYLPGENLDYKKDLESAGHILADIHNTELPENIHLLSPDNPIKAIYQESLEMFSVYANSEFANPKTKSHIEKLLAKGKNINTFDLGHRSIINTELNSGNFLINPPGEKSYLIDWEKPLYAYPAQDLGHFLTPTTTFWKTDVILSQGEIWSFLEEYCKHSNQYDDPVELWASVKNYLSMNCLRGITWCSMAYVDYQDPNKLISNEYTYEKIKIFLSEEFLNMIMDKYLKDY